MKDLGLAIVVMRPNQLTGKIVIRVRDLCDNRRPVEINKANLIQNVPIDTSPRQVYCQHYIIYALHTIRANGSSPLLYD